MGALIQTKGTLRLAKLFNDVFSHDPDDKVGLPQARRIRTSNNEALLQEFKKVANSLWEISDLFIAQFASPPTGNPKTTTWPADGNDVLYPSATMVVVAQTSRSELQFKLPTGVSMPSYIADGAAVSYPRKGKKKAQRGTTVDGTPSAAADGTFSVKLSLPLTDDAKAGDFVCFAKGKHQQLVRRWRWYLKNDLRPENDTAIKQAIYSALQDKDCERISFQAIEDIQKVVKRTETLLDEDMELGDRYNLHIVLMTDQTTAPDPLDPQ